MAFHYYVAQRLPDILRPLDHRMVRLLEVKLKPVSLHWVYDEQDGTVHLLIGTAHKKTKTDVATIVRQSLCMHHLFCSQAAQVSCVRNCERRRQMIGKAVRDHGQFRYGHSAHTEAWQQFPTKAAATPRGRKPDVAGHMWNWWESVLDKASVSRQALVQRYVDECVRLRLPCDLAACNALVNTMQASADLAARDALVARIMRAAAADDAAKLPESLPQLPDNPAAAVEDSNRTTETSPPPSKQPPGLPVQVSKQPPGLPVQVSKQPPELPVQVSKQPPGLPVQVSKQPPGLPVQVSKQPPGLPGPGPDSKQPPGPKRLPRESDNTTGKKPESKRGRPTTKKRDGGDPLLSADDDDCKPMRRGKADAAPPTLPRHYKHISEILAERKWDRGALDRACRAKAAADVVTTTTRQFQADDFLNLVKQQFLKQQSDAAHRTVRATS